LSIDAIAVSMLAPIRQQLHLSCCRRSVPRSEQHAPAASTAAAHDIFVFAHGRASYARRDTASRPIAELMGLAEPQ